MPLPAANTPWPPREWQPIMSDYRTWDAWWTGDTQALWNVYQGADSGVQRRRGIAGFIQRFFWGRETTPGQRPSRGDLHVPIAADLCATSADLLYSEPPAITSTSQATQDRLEAYEQDGLVEQLLAGAEKGAALGGRYQRVTWDTTLTDHAFLSTVDADNALPEFRWGRLTAVTFWTVLHATGHTVLRHLERHELDAAGNGITLHGLYEGTPDNLGMLVPLTEHPATAPLAVAVDQDSKLAAGITPGLAVSYIPNITPTRRWRKSTAGHDLGRSDLDGLEPLMDALDETYSAWMRDIRLGKARVFADRNMLETTVPDRDGNRHQVFNLDQEVFTPLDGLAGGMRDAVPIKPQQFAIRVDEHERTAQALTQQIIRAARYSTATFGDDTGDVEVTATEVKARQARTMSTRGRKVRLEQPALTRLLSKMLTVDQVVFGQRGLDPDTVKVEFPDLVQATPTETMTGIQALRSAGLMSRVTGIQLAHPDWDEHMVQDELARVLAEQPLTSPDDWTPQGITGEGD